MATKKYYIKERNNPQFDKPYYVPQGQLTKKEAKAKTEGVYGTNYMLEYNTEAEYNAAIEELREKGFKI